MDYIASAENIAAKLCKKYRRIDRLLADMAAIEAAEIYDIAALSMVCGISSAG